MSIILNLGLVLLALLLFKDANAHSNPFEHFDLEDLKNLNPFKFNHVDKNELKGLRPFYSMNKVLDIVLVAEEVPAGVIYPEFDNGTKLWQYQSCVRTYKDQMSCPEYSYAPRGTQLNLMPGDLVRIRLVNRLPKYRTNLHFHGFLVTTAFDGKKFGDYVFVTCYNSLVEKEVEEVELPLVLKKDFIDYEFRIPHNHPSGLYWFHAHAMQKMVAGTQVNERNVDMINAGLSGAIVIGKMESYVSNIARAPQSTLLLRTTYILGNGKLAESPSPFFCNNTAPQNGYCDGIGPFQGSFEYFPVSGQVFPTLTVPARTGSVWRLVQSLSTSVVVLSLIDDETGKRIPFQVLWVDGASLLANPGKMVESIFFMPGSRIDIFIPSSPYQKTATFMSVGPSHGVDPNFRYPNVNLAKVKFIGGKPPNPKLPVARSAGSVTAVREEPREEDTDYTCANTRVLPANHRRRVTFQSIFPLFTLGFAEIDEYGHVVPGTQTPQRTFDPDRVDACVKLGATEVWEVDNISEDDHNFHLHQVKFLVRSTSPIRPGFVFPEDYVDSVPLAPHSRTVVEIPFHFGGSIPVHCHLGFHSDSGMMGRVHISNIFKEGW